MHPAVAADILFAMLLLYHISLSAAWFRKVPVTVNRQTVQFWGEKIHYSSLSEIAFEIKGLNLVSFFGR